MAHSKYIFKVSAVRNGRIDCQLFSADEERATELRHTECPDMDEPLRSYFSGNRIGSWSWLRRESRAWAKVPSPRTIYSKQRPKRARTGKVGGRTRTFGPPLCLRRRWPKPGNPSADQACCHLGPSTWPSLRPWPQHWLAAPPTPWAANLCCFRSFLQAESAGSRR